jgi:hypothetical protein
LAKRTQSGKYRLLIIGVAVLSVFVAMQVTQAQKKGGFGGCCIQVMPGDIQSLEGKLQGFERQLSGQEMGAMGLVLWRAATAPLDDPSGTDMRGSFFDLGSPTETAPGQKKKIGGAGPQPPAADSEAVKILYAASGVGNASMGWDAPSPDIINALATKLRGFGNQLSPKERGIMNWLFQRAGSNEIRESPRQTGPLPGTPGGMQPPTLGQALGTAAFGSRRGINSPNGWVLRIEHEG